MSAAEQLSLALPRAPVTRAERFAEFHAKNPHIYSLLRQYAREALDAARRRGRSRIGLRMIWERMRYALDVETERVAGDEYALNDHFPPFYARLLMHREPDLRDAFEIRERGLKAGSAE